MRQTTALHTNVKSICMSTYTDSENPICRLVVICMTLDGRGAGAGGRADADGAGNASSRNPLEKSAIERGGKSV